MYNSGTPCYMSLDFVILQQIKYEGFKDIINNSRVKHILVNNLYRSIKNNLSSFSKKGLNKTYLSGYNVKIDKNEIIEKSSENKK